MKKNISMQMKLMLSQKSFKFTVFALFAYACIAFIVSFIPVFGRAIIAVPNAYSHFVGNSLSSACFYIFSAIAPIVCVVPFADSYFRDYKKNTLPVIVPRSSPKKYYFSKGIAVFISGFAVAFVCLLTSYILTTVFFPLSQGCDISMFPTYYSDFYIKGYWTTGILFEELFVLNPYLYNLLFLFISSILSGIYAIIVYNISYFTKKQHILMLASVFIITNVLSIVSTLFKDLNIRIENYFYAFVKVGDIKTINIIIMVVIYSLLIFAPIPYCLKKLKDVL